MSKPYKGLQLPPEKVVGVSLGGGERCVTQASQDDSR